jgi:hypothetical protein
VYKAVAAVVAALSVTVGLVVFIGSRRGSSHATTSGPTTTAVPLTPTQQSEQTAATKWEEEADTAFGGASLGDTVSAMVQGVNDWQQGNTSTQQFNDDSTQWFGDLVAARQRVAKLRAFPLAPGVNDLYLRSADLYVETVRLDKLLPGLPEGDARTQLGLLAKRVRELADRIFDRGRAIVTPFLHEPPLQNVEVHLPEEVPIWTDEGLAPGPPLDDAPPPPAAAPPLRQPDRPTEGRTRWVSAVQASGIPDVAKLVAAVTGNPDRDVARSLVSAAEKLRIEPDPDGPDGRELSARVRLGLLTSADAVRSAQLAADVPDPNMAARLRTTARRLALVGEGLWLPDLPARPTGFDPALLTQTGV